MNKAKKAKIKMTLRQTKQRHSQMDCKTYELKVVKNKLNKNQKEEINKLFREAK